MISAPISANLKLWNIAANRRPPSPHHRSKIRELVRALINPYISGIYSRLNPSNGLLPRNYIFAHGMAAALRPNLAIDHHPICSSERKPIHDLSNLSC